MTERPQVTVESLKTGEGVVRAVVRTPDRDTPLRVQPLGVGRYLVEVGTRRLTVTLARGSTADWGQADGHTVRWPHATQAPACGDGRHDGTHAAAIPATVTDVRVAPGDTVASGDTLVILEAMKMEMPLRARRPGRVTALQCAVGDQVQPGVPLVELEEID